MLSWFICSVERDRVDDLAHLVSFTALENFGRHHIGYIITFPKHLVHDGKGFNLRNFAIRLCFLNTPGLKVRVGLNRIEVVSGFEGLKDRLAAIGLKHSKIVLLNP